MAETCDPPGLADAVRILAVEVSPLWEVLWDVADRLPHADEAARIAVAARAVAALLAEGMVELVWTRWTLDGVERRVADPAEHPAILTNPLYWVRVARHEPYVEIHHAPGRGGRR
jgi:hypothetical protein